MNDAIDREHRTFRFERVLEATPEGVFDAWTTPSEVTEWWDPSGEPLTSCSIDLRIGGAFRFETAGHAPAFEGTYALIERPHRLEFVAMGARGSVELQAHTRGTLMKVAIECPTQELFEMYGKLRVAEGTNGTLDNLVRKLAPSRESA
jgi:uncharacterized protein YndB with AHSA1/START domain